MIIDKRTKFNKRLPVYIALIWLLMGFTILMISLFKSPKLLNPGIVALPQPVEAMETPYHDALSYLRYKGQQEGIDDYTISKIIRVMRCESGFELNEKAVGKVGDSGIGQILPSTWLAYGCSGDIFTYKDNIDCIYKIFNKSGFRPWTCRKVLNDK